MTKPSWSDTVLVLLLGLGTAAMVAVPVLLVRIWQPRYEEVLRLASHGIDVEAVVFEGGGGATSSLRHEVYVVPPGRPIDANGLVAAFDGAQLGELAFGVSCRWSSPTTLVIEYDCARVAETVTPPEGAPAHGVVVELAAGRTFAMRQGTMQQRCDTNGR